MKITDYSFGRITIDGQTYRSDIIIYPDHVSPSWWRKEGHLLQIEDLSDAVSANPDVLVIGTGSFGVMKVPETTLDYLRRKNIETYIEKTGRAVRLYNEISEKRSSVAVLHLTC
jgi:hypothetical protein